MRKLLSFSFLILVWRPVFGQEPECGASVRYLSTFRWATASERRFLPKRAVVRANISLSQGERLLIYETRTASIKFPYSGDPKAEFKIVFGEKELLSVSMAQIPELHGFSDGMRPTYIARSCTNDGRDLVVVASGSGATGESQFFLVFAGRNGQYRYFTLPVSEQGKIELSAKEPGKVLFWSAVLSELGGSNATPKHYEISTYKLEEDGFHLVSSSRTKRKYAPFLDYNIVFRDSGEIGR